MEEMVTWHIYAADYDRLRSWQLAEWCQRQGADEWTISTMIVGGEEPALFDRFDEATEPFRLLLVKRRHLTAHSLNDFLQPTILWRLNLDSLVVLQQFLPDGLFTYESSNDIWFENPIFYRNGELMLGIVSHECEGIVRITENEQAALEAEGFLLRAAL